jgi:hypothetical protein
MIAALFIIAAIVLVWFWVRYAIRTFATVCRCMWRVAIETRNIVRHLVAIVRILTTPRCPLLDDFMARRARR